MRNKHTQRTILAILLLAGNSMAVNPTNMILVTGGTFAMGDSRGDGLLNELPVHTVTVDTFRISECEITEGEMDRVVNWAITNRAVKIEKKGNNSTIYLTRGAREHPLFDNFLWRQSKEAERTRTKNDPYQTATWYCAAAYCNFRSEMEGLIPCYDMRQEDWECDFSATGYRLPTEAEWEYAARGGTMGRNTRYSGSDDLYKVGWFILNSGGRLSYEIETGYSRDYSSGQDFRFEREIFGLFGGRVHPAGGKAPNELGLFDMSGNAVEWCNDWYDFYKEDSQKNPAGATPQRNMKYPSKVQRGSFWGGAASSCRVSARQAGSPEHPQGGFRVVRGNLSGDEQSPPARTGVPLENEKSSTRTFKQTEIDPTSMDLMEGGVVILSNARGSDGRTNVSRFAISRWVETEAEVLDLMRWAYKTEKVYFDKKMKALVLKELDQTLFKTKAEDFWIEDVNHSPRFNWPVTFDRTHDFTWNAAAAYCNLRSEKENLTPCYSVVNGSWECNFAANGYRIPTAAEWEYAARHWDANKLPKTVSNNTKPSNAREFRFDIGCLKEWCNDRDFTKKSVSETAFEPAQEENRSQMAYSVDANHMLIRTSGNPDEYSAGLRVVRTVVVAESP